MADLKDKQVLVLGQGLVGSFAAQIFQIAGADVLAADLSAFRLQRARDCGIEQLVNATEQDLKEAVMDWSSGAGARIAVDATGTTPGIFQAIECTQPLGEVILLGTPRKATVVNATPALMHTHRMGITIKGAERGHHYGVLPSPFQPYSSRTDLEQVMAWFQSGQMQTEPLLTHLLESRDAQAGYQGLLHDIEHHLGVVFDWT